MDRVLLSQFCARFLDPSSLPQQDPDGRGRPMRSGIHGTFATLLLMVPVLSIPALAIFGIPQFAPVVASPLDEGPDQHHEKRVGKSDRHDDDMMDDMGHAPSFGDDNPTRSGNGRIGDAIPLNRDRNGSFRDESFGARQRSQPDNNPPPRSSWQDEPRGDLHRPQDNFDDSFSRNSRPEPPSGELKDMRIGTRQSPSGLGGAHIQPAVMPKGQESPGPRGAGRSRDRLPETGAPGRQEPAFSWQDAVDRLNELGIRSFRLQQGERENQYAFVCNYSPDESPRVSYRFEAEADQPLRAVEKVLEQIAEWQQRR